MREKILDVLEKNGRIDLKRRHFIIAFKKQEFPIELEILNRNII